MKSQSNISLIIKRIHKISKQYKNELVNKTFLILYEGKAVEITYRIDNFLHLCGVETNLTAKDFYRRAVHSKLSCKEIQFTQKHPYNLAEIKTKHLSKALSLINRDAFVVSDITTQTKSFILGTTDLEIVLCFDLQINKSGKIISPILIPYSLRVEDIPNNKFSNMYEVDYVLSKETGTKHYMNIEYGNPDFLTSYLEKHSISDYSINISDHNSSTK